ncbi:MAG TPA: hypothetical protein VKQ52_09360, partial [Puia sp.]|nr:hypothetical protein [Puia sp.]
MKKITPHLYQLDLGFVNAFLIEDIVPSPDPADDPAPSLPPTSGLIPAPDLTPARAIAPGFTLVDTGTPGNLSKIFAQLK